MTVYDSADQIDLAVVDHDSCCATLLLLGELWTNNPFHLASLGRNKVFTFAGIFTASTTPKKESVLGIRGLEVQLTLFPFRGKNPIRDRLIKI